MSENRIAVFALMLATSILVFSGCGRSMLPPPVTVTYRSSLLGIGQVAGITNNSNHHLYNVKVVGRSFKEKSSASVKVTDHLSPGSTVEVGWFEFGSWVPQSGETLEVYADDYATPRVSIIPSFNNK
jgi:hypothetical protein